MKSAFLSARHHIRDIQETTRRYHDTTQRFLHAADRIADDIATTPWTPRCDTTYKGKWCDDDTDRLGTDWYRHDPATQRLTSIIDGADDHRWKNRYETFSDELSRLGTDQAAYLHGYLDAQRYLNDNHSVLAHAFHETVNYDGLGYSTPSRRTTPPARPTQL